MASLNKILLAGAVPIGTPGLSHFDRILGQALGGREVEKTATPGDIVTFTTNLAKPLTSLKVLITATQSGTGDPSPTNIRPITGWTGCNVWRTGTNVWDEQTELGIYDSTTGEKKPSTTQLRAVNFTATKPGLTYYFQSNSNSRVLFYDRSRALISTVLIRDTTFTTPAGCYFFAFHLGTGYGTTYKNDCCVNYPATATAYAPYTGQTYTTDFGDAGTVYGGTLDVLTGVLTVTDILTTIDEHSGATVASVGGVWFVNNIAIIDKGAGLKMCDAYTLIASQANTTNFKNAASVGQFSGCTDASRKTRVFFRDERFEDTESLNAFLANNPVHIVQALATPQTYQLTPQAVDALLGENVVFADTGAVSELKYLVKE